MTTELEKEEDQHTADCNNQVKDKNCIESCSLEFFFFFFTSVIFKKAAVLEMTFPCVSIAPLGFPDEEKSRLSR